MYGFHFADVRFSGQDRTVLRRWIYSAVFLFCISLSGTAMPELLSPDFTTVSNTEKETALQWEFENPLEKAEHTVLLFMHGPVSSATFFIDELAWYQTKGRTRIDSGNKNDIPEKFKTRLPTIQLREFGYLAGCRVAALTLRIQLQTPFHQGEQDIIAFPRGVIRIKYDEVDPNNFTAFSKSIDESAQLLYVNYPPLKRIETENVVQTKLPYIQNPSMKLITTDTGLYSIQGRDVLESLQSKNVQVDQLAAYQLQKNVLCIVLDQTGGYKPNGTLLDNDQVIFFAEHSESSFSPDVVTWITYGQHLHVKPSPISSSTSISQLDVLHRKLHLEKDVFHIDGRKRNEEQNKHWMWHDFADGEFETSFEIDETIASTTGIITLDLDIKNNSYPLKPEHIAVTVNHQKIPGIVSNSESNKFRFESRFSSTVFQANNSLIVSITKPFQQTNPVLLDSATILFPTKLKPSVKAFYNPLKNPIINIPENTKHVWTVSTGQNNQFMSLNSTQKSINVSTHETLYFFAANPKLPSATFGTTFPIHQRTIDFDTNKQADVIIVSPREWQPVFESYQIALQHQSLSSMFVAAEDVYDIFGDGTMSPFALRTFLRFASQSWREPKPSYVVLAGDATWDYWGRYQNGIVNHLPAYQGDQNYAIENWFVRVDDLNDPLPDMVISRIPVRTGDELRTVIDKALAFRITPPLSDWLNKMLVLTDHEFEEYTDELTSEWIPQGFQVTDRHVEDYLLVDNIYLPAAMRATTRAKTSLEATDDIIKRLNDGVLFWQYFGHGAPNVMGKQRLFFGGGSKFSDVKKLSANAKPHILWSFSCETTRFDYPHEKWNISIGEDLLTLPNGGTVALMGAAGRGFPQDHILLARALHTTAFEYGLSTFGLQYFTAQMMGLAFKHSFEPIDQFAIFGDPALPMPQFIELKGTLTDTDSQYLISFPSDERFINPLNGKYWMQDKNGTEYEIIEEINNENSNPLELSVSKQSMKPYENGKIGVYLIDKNNDQMVIRHGSVTIPSNQIASNYIEPTTGSLPDLAFTPNKIVMHPLSPRSGESVLIEAEISNKGKASAQHFVLQGFTVLDSGNEQPLEVIVGHRLIKIASLHPGETRLVKFRWDPTANAGEHTIRLKIDPESRIRESNEENNSLDVHVHVKKKSDLVLEEDNVTVSKTPDGRFYNVSFKVVNEGESVAEKVVVQIKVTINGQEQSLTLPLDQNRVVIPTSVAPNGVYSANDIKLPVSIESLEIIVDPDEIVDEESHENNSYLFQPKSN